MNEKTDGSNLINGTYKWTYTQEKKIKSPSNQRNGNNNNQGQSGQMPNGAPNGQPPSNMPNGQPPSESQSGKNMPTGQYGQNGQNNNGSGNPIIYFVNAILSFSLVSIF